MIEIPTTFIIGAGASVPYGFPSGQRLVEMLCDPSMNSPLQETETSLEMYQRFSIALQMSQLTSIDTFLEQYAAEFGYLGRLAIASKLLPLENAAPLRSVAQTIQDTSENVLGGHWLRRLWDCMKTRTLDEFANNKVNFVVFNYDRVLEQYLWMVIRGTYPNHDEINYAEAMNSIAIIHPYGSLGRFEFGNPSAGHFKGEGESVEFGKYSPMDLKHAAHAIRIISEQRESDEPFEEAVSLMRASKRLLFLGFGYEKTNMERLRILDWCKNKLKKSSVTSPFAHAVGSAFGLEPAEAYKVRSTYFLGSSNCLGSLKDDSLMFLRSRVNLETSEYDRIVATRYAHDIPGLLGVDAPS